MRFSLQRRIGRISLVAALLLLNATVTIPQSLPHASPGAAVSSDKLALPVNFERHTGDLNEMIQRQQIRALVLYSRSGFFYLDGRPEGIYYEALHAFEQFVNQTLHPKRRVQVTFIPVRADKIEMALNQGVGDLIAYGIEVTPEREQRVAFSTPIMTNVKQIVVAGKDFGPTSSLEDLSGRKIFVNPLTTYVQSLKKVNNSLRAKGKPPVLIEPADKSLLDEDLMEMVNAGLIPATVTTTARAELWSKVFSSMTPLPNIVVGSDGDLAFAMRKDSPKLKQVMDEFVRTHAVGTSFGNTLVRRYLQNAEWVKEATSESEIKKFDQTATLFKKYAAQYGFDYLMIVAQGYQESMLNQSARSPGGAVGIMQVKPKIAAAAPISISDISTADNNIHAGVKLLHEIAATYFKDPKIDPVNRLLFTFAAYNAGPTRISDLRKKAAAQGLDPDKWFDNVELLVARDVGQITVQYVNNIYKYYVAYKLVTEQGKSLS